MEWVKVGEREGEVERKGFERRKENRLRGIRGFLVCKIYTCDTRRCTVMYIVQK